MSKAKQKQKNLNLFLLVPYDKFWYANFYLQELHYGQFFIPF